MQLTKSSTVPNMYMVIKCLSGTVCFLYAYAIFFFWQPTKNNGN